MMVRNTKKRGDIRRRSKALFRLSGILVLIAAHFFSTLAAPIGLTPLAVTPGSPLGAITLSEIERINLFNGQFAFVLPLLSIGGRGKLNHTITLPIQRRLHVENIPFDMCLSGLCGTDCSLESCGYQYTKILKPVPTQTAFPGPLKLTGKRELMSLISSQSPNYIATLSRLTLTMADGTEYELRDKNTNGQPFEWTGFINSPPAAFPRGTEFVSSDGSFITFYSNDQITDRRPGMLSEPNHPFCGGQHHCEDITTPSGILMFADGTRYDISQGRTTRVSDSNGNRIEFQYTTQTTTTGTQVTVLSSILDPLDREATITYANVTGNAYDEIQYKGVDEVARSVKIYRQSLEQTLVHGGALPTKGVLYPELHPTDNSKDNPSVVSRVELANGRSYTFKYNDYGEPARLELPTGGVVEYTFGGGVQGGTASGLYGSLNQVNTNETYLYRRITERRLYVGGNLTGFTTYSKSDVPNPNVFPTRTSPLPHIEVKNFEAHNGTCYTNQTCQVLGVERHFFNSSAAQSYAGSNLSTQFKRSRYPHWNEGRQFKTELLDADATTVLRRQELTWDQSHTGWWNAIAASEPINNPRVIEWKLSIFTPGGITLVSKKQARNPATLAIGYDQFNNLTDMWEFDFGNGTPGKLLRHTHTDFVTDPTYTGSPLAGGAHLRRLPRAQQVFSVNPANNQDVAVVSSSEIFYDEALYLEAAYPTITGWVAPASTARGNPTSSKGWNNFNGTSFQAFPQGSYITTHSGFDQAGNLVKAIDALGRESTISFTDADGDNDLGNHAFPTSTTSPIADSTGVRGSNTALTTLRTYDHSTGLVISATDLRGQVTTVEYNDELSRPTRVVPPTGGAEIEFEYEDDPQNTQSPGNVYSKVRTKIDENNWNEAFTYFDGFGRKVKAETHDATGTIFSEVAYDSLGRVTKTAAPYRAGADKFWVETIYDSLGRVKEVISPKIANEPVAAKITSEFSTCALGLVTVGINQAGNKTRSITNALGQLVRFDEANNSNDLGPVDTPNQPTFYKYDAVGNLRRVTQGSQDPDAAGFNPATLHQSRFYLFDSLSRMIRVRQPEQDTNSALAITDPVTSNGQWSTGFTHLDTGNIGTITDAKGAITTFSYDNLDRPVQRTYSLPQTTDPKKITFSTSTVSMKYDGRLSATPDNQNPGIVPLAKGALTEVSNGISMSQQTGFNGVGKITSSKQITDGQVYIFGYEYNLEGTLKSQTYPSGRVVTNSFDSTGDLTSVASGSVVYASDFRYTPKGTIDQLKFGNNRWQTSKTNARQQVIEIALGTSATDTSLWKVQYDYGRLDANGTLDVSKNDGNVIRQTITVPGVTDPFVQTYKYDSLNRISEALEKSASNENWKQTFGYDRFGNRNSFTYHINQVAVTLNTTNNPTIDAWTNRINTGQGHDYDFNGNIILDSQGRKLTFDAENKQREIKDAGNQVIATYDYDGSGQRIKKTSGGNTTVFVYNIHGQLIAEYASQPPPAGGRTYITADILNSPRVLSNQNGDVSSRRDFMPFGETIGVSRSVNQKYGINDGLRKSFTGYERDTESSLDFAEARYYNPAHGRFTAVDPLLASGISSNPQTFNRYVYAGNNPTQRTDPNGEAWYVESYWHLGIRVERYRWHSENLTLIKNVARSHLVYFNSGKIQGLVALDPWENRYKVVSSVAEGQQQIEQYKRDAALNFLAGAAEAHSLILELSGALDGFKVNRNSEQFKLGSKTGTITSLLMAAAGGPSAVNYLLGKSGTAVKFAAKELNLVGRAKTVIGHHPAYLQLAEKLGANVLNIPMDVWNKMTDAERWLAHEKFLNDAIARGDDFVLATPLNQVREGSWYEMEIKYLLSKGYVPNAEGTMLVRPW